VNRERCIPYERNSEQDEPRYVESGRVIAEMNVDMLYDRVSALVPQDMGLGERAHSFVNRPMYQHVYYGYRHVMHQIRRDELEGVDYDELEGVAYDDVDINLLDPNDVISDDIAELMELGGLLAVRRVQALEEEKIDENITVKPKNLSDSSHNQ